MSDAPNPFEPPRDVDDPTRAPPPPAQPSFGRTVLLEERSRELKIAWDAAFEADRVWLTPANEPTISLTHAQLIEQANFMFIFSTPVLQLKHGGRPRPLKLDPEAAALLRAWMEPMISAHTKKALKQRTRFGVPLGVFLLFSQLLSAGDLDVLIIVFGLGTMVVGLGSWFWPRSGWFLADAALWTVWAMSHAVWTYERHSWWSGFMTVACLFFTAGSLRLWQFYRRL